MATADTTTIRFCDADPILRQRVVAKLKAPARPGGHLRLGKRTIHLDDGFTILAMKDDEPVAVISVCWKKLADPLATTEEAYIDLIDVDPEFRRQGLAWHLVELAARRAMDAAAYQMRAWTSATRPDAIRMWRALGFALCPTVILAGPQEERVPGYFAVRRLAR